VSTTQGHLFTTALAFVGAVMLAPLPPTVGVYAAVMTLMLIIYPLDKRYTDFLQVSLGCGFAIPVRMCPAALIADPLLQLELFGGSDTKAPVLGAI